MFNLNKVKFLIGKKIPNKLSLEPFDPLVCNFFDDLSQSLIKSRNIKKYSDVMTFAFYIRLKNLIRIKNLLHDNFIRKGIGTVFHITPSNVPINFAYSFLFALISGNSNIVRVPTRDFFQVKIICKHLNKIFKKKKYEILKKSNLFIRYKKDIEINKNLSLLSDGRMIWGGDKTVEEFKNYNTKIKSSDIFFNDKYSISLINSDELLKIKNPLYINRLIENFYNDTLLIDQNACSSPHLILWKGKNSLRAQDLFWKNLLKFSKKKYKLEDIAISDKFTQYSFDLMLNKNIDRIVNYNCYLFRAKLKKLPTNVSDLRGKWGYFYEATFDKYSDLIKIFNNKFQTVSYYGFKKDELRNFIRENNIDGVDRIVPIGRALDIGMIWDGYNIKNNLTRIIDLQ
jgi:hypothetical protein